MIEMRRQHQVPNIKTKYLVSILEIPQTFRKICRQKKYSQLAFVCDFLVVSSPADYLLEANDWLLLGKITKWIF